MYVVPEVLALSGVAYTITVVTAHYSRLPEKVPTHFDIRGVPDRWGAKWSVWAHVIAACGLYVFLSLMAWLLRIATASPSAPDMFGASVLAWVKAEIIWISAFVASATVAVAKGRRRGLGIWFLPVILVMTLGTTGILLWLIRISH